MSASPTEPAQAALERLARRLRTLRERRGLTQEELAQRAALSVSFLSLLERGERSPSYDTLVHVARALGLPLSELVREEAPPPAGADAAGAERLVRFARERQLTRAEVDRLLTVADALFGGHAPRPEPARDACGEAGCGRPVLARGLCVRHYHRARRTQKATGAG